MNLNSINEVVSFCENHDLYSALAIEIYMLRNGHKWQKDKPMINGRYLMMNSTGVFRFMFVEGNFVSGFKKEETFFDDKRWLGPLPSEL